MTVNFSFKNNVYFCFNYVYMSVCGYVHAGSNALGGRGQTLLELERAVSWSCRKLSHGCWEVQVRCVPSAAEVSL